MSLVNWEELLETKTLDDLPKTAGNAALVLASLPLQILLTKVLEWYLPWFLKLFSWMGKGNRFGIPGLLAVLVLFSIDDVGTAKGLQGEEVPRQALEGNLKMAGLWQYMIENGVAKTETDAHRLVWLWFMGTILVTQYFGWFNALARYVLYIIGALKAYAGYSWWNVKPNKYTLMDFLTFQPTRRTSERCVIHLQLKQNKRLGYTDPRAPAVERWLKNPTGGLAEWNELFARAEIIERGGLSERRRLTATPGVRWLTRYLPYLFPYI